MTAPSCLEKSANLLKRCTMKNVKQTNNSVCFIETNILVCVFGVCKVCLTPFILIHLQFLPPPPPIWHGFLFASHHVDQLLFVNFSIFFPELQGFQFQVNYFQRDL